MKLLPEETKLVGRWIVENRKAREDATTERIRWLVAEALIKVTEDWSKWYTLYRDPSDGRYWELSYPQSEFHGGGPPCLQTISDDDIRARYQIEPQGREKNH